MAKKAKKFTTEKYKQHLEAQGRDSSGVVEDIGKAYDMASAGHRERVKAALLRKVGRNLIKGAEESEHTTPSIFEDTRKRDVQERVAYQNEHMLATIVLDVMSKYNPGKLLSAVRTGSPNHSMRDTETAALVGRYSPNRPSMGETMRQLYELGQEYEDGENVSTDQMSYADVAGTVILPRKKNYREPGYHTGEEIEEDLKEYPEMDYHFPSYGKEVEQAVSDLARKRDKALYIADTEEYMAGLAHDEVKLKAGKPTYGRHLLKKFD